MWMEVSYDDTHDHEDDSRNTNQITMVEPNLMAAYTGDSDLMDLFNHPARSLLASVT